MSTWQQTQIPYGSGAAPPPPGYYPQGAPYLKADGGYLSVDKHPPPHTNGEKGIPDNSQNNSFNSPENFDFSNKTIHKNFICKVYSIVMCNLLIKLMIVTMASFYGETKHFIKKNQWFNTIAGLIVFGILIARFWFVELYRKSPFNFILLFVFTLAESVTTIFFSYQYAEQNDIIMASGLMILICFALIIIASLTKIEFTVKGCFLLIAAIIPVIILSAFIVSIFFPDILITFISASLQAIIFSSFLIYDTQKIISGNHKYSISPKEYIFTALTILLDFIIFCLAILLLILIGAFLLMIFLFIIQLIMKNE